MRVDTHVHLWQRGDGHRVLIRERLAALDRDFTMDGLAPELDAAGVQRVILVSAAQEEAETDALLAAARAAPDRVLGVVGWLDLEAVDFSERLTRYAADSLWLGLRLPLTILPDPRWILRPSVRENLAVLARTGRIAEILARPDQLADVAEAIGDLPGLRVLIDHAGNPTSGAVEPDWRAGMARLGARPETWVKIAAFWAPGQPPVSEESVRPLLETVFDAFAENRRVASANWPVSALGMAYREPWDRLERLSAALGLDGRQCRLLFGENALALVDMARQGERTS